MQFWGENTLIQLKSSFQFLAGSSINHIPENMVISRSSEISKFELTQCQYRKSKRLRALEGPMTIVFEFWIEPASLHFVYDSFDWYIHD